MKRQWLALVVLTLIVKASWAQTFTLKFHHFMPAGSMPPTKMMKPWCDAIEKDSAGKLKCQMYPAMQLGGTPAQLVDQVKDGVADIIFTLPGYSPGRFPIMEVFELPFFVNNATQGAQAAWDFYEKYATKEFAGMKVLMVATHDRGYIHTTDKAVKTMGDLKGLKLRAPTRMTNKLLASLGATPLGMPLPQIPESVSKGVVDGFMLPWETVPALKLHELVNHHTETPPTSNAFYVAVFIIAMNQARYDQLPTDLKKVIDQNSGAKLAKLAGQAWDNSSAEGRKPAEERKNNFHALSQTEVEIWMKASSNLSDEWVANMNKVGLNGALMLEDAKSLLKKYR